jgi:hypothetical protein
MCRATFWAIFFTNPSGHPGRNQQLEDNRKFGQRRKREQKWRPRFIGRRVTGLLGDQTGLIFAHWVIVFFAHILKKCRISRII